MERLWEDESLVVFNKPSGLLVHPTEDSLHPSSVPMETCLSLARKIVGKKVFPVHRLDRATSGILIFAKSATAAAKLCEQFSSGGVKKQYKALVRGWLTSSIEVNNPVWNEIRTQRIPACTVFEPMQFYEIPRATGKHQTARYSLVNAFPRTGRYHQIRQHLKHLSHPIIGDTTHGDGTHNRHFREWFGFHRLFLHAQSIDFPHPTTNATIKIEAPLSQDLNCLENILEEYARNTEMLRL